LNGLRPFSHQPKSQSSIQRVSEAKLALKNPFKPVAPFGFSSPDLLLSLGRDLEDRRRRDFSSSFESECDKMRLSVDISLPELDFTPLLDVLAIGEVN
jgi:hypothetical protein